MTEEEYMERVQKLMQRHNCTFDEAIKLIELSQKSQTVDGLVGFMNKAVDFLAKNRLQNKDRSSSNDT